MIEAILSRQKFNFWRGTLTLSLAILLTRATNFATQMVIAHRFGASGKSDAYFVVENILLLLGSFIITGFVVAFIPLWLEYQVQRGDREAQNFSNAFISLSTGATVLLAVFIALAARMVVKLVAPGFSGNVAETATQLLTTMAPAVAFLGLTAGCTALLQAHHRFIRPELSYMSYNLIILIAAVALSARFGVMGLAWGTIIGSFVRLMVQLPNTLRIRTIHLTFRINHEGMRQVGKRILPIFFVYAGLQVTMLIGNMVASGLPEGAVSSLVYASRVMLLPVGLLALPLQTTIFPTLSQLVAKDQLKVMGETAIRGFCFLSFALLPVTAGLVLMKVPLTQLLFQRGAFDSAATQTTATILGWYSLALPAIGSLMLINSIFCSLGEPFTLVIFNFFNWATTLGLGLALMRRYGPSGIAFSISLTTTVTCILALLALKRRLPTLRIRSLVESILKASVAAGVMTIVLLTLKALLAGAFQSFELAPVVHSLITLLIGLLVGGIVYGLSAIAFRIEEALALFQIVLKWARQRGLAK